MPSKQHRPDSGGSKVPLAPDKAETSASSKAVASQEQLRNELGPVDQGSSYILGVVNEGTAEDAGTRGGFSLGSNSKSVSGLDLGSSRGDKFGGISSDLGDNTKSVSGLDLGSSRGDKFGGISSDLGDTKNVSGLDLGSSRGGTLDPDQIFRDIPQLAPAQGENVSVSLPLMQAVEKVDAGGTLTSGEQSVVAKEIEEKATLIEPKDIPEGLLEALPEKTILRFAFSPEDMGALDLQAEHDAVAKVADVFTINNPTIETMQHVLATGQFEDVIWSGHGSKDGLWITDTDGNAKKLLADDVAALMQDTGVQEVLLNVCDGGNEVDDALGLAGINSFSHKREIIDEEAIANATQFADAGNLWGIETEGRSGGRVLTARKAQKKAKRRDEQAERNAQTTAMVENWQQKKASKKKGRSLRSGSRGSVREFSKGLKKARRKSKRSYRRNHRR